MKKISLTEGDALIITNIQNDLLPGGRLAVPAGDAIIPQLNNYLARFNQQQLPIFLTRDWHPSNHCSFTSAGGEWPPHCIANTIGADIASDLNVPDNAVIISKSIKPETDAHSAFQGTQLNNTLHRKSVRRLFIGGLATDYCVLHTALEAVRQGYQVYLLEDAIRAFNNSRLDGIRAERQMCAKGVKPITFEQIDCMASSPAAAV